MFPERTLDFERDAPDWPNRDASRFVEASGIRWHVQELGSRSAPGLLLLHGTGAASHSWRGMIPLLAPHFRILVVDLPGHGFTQRPPARLFTLPGMAAGVCDLLHTLKLGPDVVAGHSAGAAVMLRMALDCKISPKALVSLNGALKPYGGEANRLVAPLAKLMFLNPFTPRFFAWQAGSRRAVERLIRNTGSTIDAEGIDQYRLLVSNPDHVAAAIGMMANWELKPLSRDLPILGIPLLLVAGTGDKAIKSEDAFAIRDLVPGARVEMLRGLGHLAHEEDPRAVVDLILAFSRETGVLASEKAAAGSPADCPQARDDF